MSEIGNKSGAIAQFQAAYDLNPLDPYVGPILVTALAEAGRGAEAARLDKSLRKLWPTDLEV